MPLNRCFPQPPFGSALILSAAVLFPISAMGQAAPAEEGRVADVVVHGNRSEEAKAAERLNEVPGGTSLIGAREIERGHVSNPADILSREPGVFAQSTAGGDAIRLSIRGSNISANPLAVSRGITLFLDGLPILSPTGAPWELIEPLAANHVEILRGANAFQYGALTLGGAINYVTHTGYDSSPFQARFDAGSFGNLKGQISSGQVIGPFDYYISATGFSLDGYRDHSENSNLRFVGNVGYKISDDIETRFHFRFAHEYLQFPYTLTWAQLQADPTQANATAKKAGWYKVIPASIFIANKTSLRLDDASTLEFGLTYSDYKHTNAWGGTFLKWQTGDVLSSTLRYSRSDDIGGHQSKTTLAFLSSTILSPNNAKFEGWPNSVPFTSILNVKGALVNNVNYEGSDFVLHGQNDLEALPGLWLTTGIALSRSARTSEFNYPTYDRASKNYDNYAPRVGARYYLTPDVQVFANASRSVEAPTVYAISAAVFPGKNLDLKQQTAWTAEAGTRGKAGIFDWSIGYYHSWVENELLTVTLPGLALTGTSNATPTKHQGVEVGLGTILWQEELPADHAATRAPLDPIAVDPLRQQMLLRQAYTWSDFHYRNDPTYGTNRLPGLPVHFYKAELEYRHPIGFYAGVNVESVLNSYPIDYANTYYSQPYALLGAKIGYVAPKQAGDNYQWEAYIEGRNLTNARYAALISPVYNAKGVDQSAFYPGDGAAIYGGISFRY